MKTTHDIATSKPTASRGLALLGAMALPLSLLSAQNPCAGPTHLATQDPFQSTHYYSLPGQNNTATPPIPQNLPAGYRGFLCLFDLTANADVTVSQIDFKLFDDGHYSFHWGPAPGQTGGPGLVGQTAVVNVYTTPASWVGLSQTPSAWTLVSTGTLTVAPYDQHSPAVFSTPFVLPTGTYGVAFEVGPVTATVPHITYMPPPYALHPALLVGAFLPGAPLTASDQFLSFANEDIVNQAFVNAPGPAPKNPIFDLHYTVARNAAHSTRYGAGCYDRPQAFYEVFPKAPGAFDLSNRSFRMVPSGDNYTVSAASTAVVTPTSPGLLNANGQPMGDGDRTAVLPLGFTFPFPGGSTSSVVALSDGSVFLDPTSMGNQNWVPSVRGFLMGQPQLAPFSTDLDPRAGGSIHLDLDPAGQFAAVTWLNVPAWDILGSSNTFQVVLFANGDIEYRYGACATTKETTLVGFTPGWSAHDPGMTDISHSLPFRTGDGAIPPALDMDARPVLGTRPNLVVSDAPADAAGVMLIGLPFSGFDLRFAGMPGCVQRVLPLSFRPYHAVGTTAAVGLQIPNSRWLIGAHLFAQSFVVSSGSNAAGRTITNSLCITMGR